MKLAISSLLAERQMTQTALAEAVEIQRGFMSEIISGKKSPSIETLVRIAEVLQVPIGDLFDERPGTLGTAPGTQASNGFSDEAVPFDWHAASLRETSQVIEHMGKKVRHAVTYQVASPLPWLALLAGDILICDIATPPVDGNVILIGLTDGAGLNARTLVRRFWRGQALSPDPIEIDPIIHLATDPRAAWRATVCGVARLKI
jgi:transcriptional regulator with XRE-family HTH domain